MRLFRTRALTEQDGTFTGAVYQYSAGIVDILETSPGHNHVDSALRAADDMRRNMERAGCQY